MNHITHVYRLLSTGLFFLSLPPIGMAAALSTRHRSSLTQRMGRYPRRFGRRKGASPRVWMHAASVGEVRVAFPVAAALRRHLPSLDLVISTTSHHGQRLARQRFAAEALCVIAPVDAVVAVGAALDRLRPDVMIWLETEIWPNWIIEAHRRGIPSAMVNGRISVRSVQRYRRIRPLMAEALKRMDALSMIHTADARRVLQMGARPERVTVNGNAKGDLLRRPSREEARKRSALERLYRTSGDGPVLVAGSTRSGEEAVVYEAFHRIRRAFPDALLIVAPRHIRRARQVAQLAVDAGLTCQFRTAIDADAWPRTAAVVVLDTIGELFDAYGIATVAFCGGSLVEKGGQNLLEAASWAKPVLYGPSTEDFQEARERLEAVGGGYRVDSSRTLAERFIALASDPSALARIGGNARKAVVESRGAAERHAAVIRSLLR